MIRSRSLRELRLNNLIMLRRLPQNLNLGFRRLDMRLEGRPLPANANMMRVEMILGQHTTPWRI
jgi:hypothetical protein